MSQEPGAPVSSLPIWALARYLEMSSTTLRQQLEDWNLGWDVSNHMKHLTAGQVAEVCNRLGAFLPEMAVPAAEPQTEEITASEPTPAPAEEPAGVEPAPEPAADEGGAEEAEEGEKKDKKKKDKKKGKKKKDKDKKKDKKKGKKKKDKDKKKGKKKEDKGEPEAPTEAMPETAPSVEG